MRANKGRHAGQVPHCKFYFRAWLQLAINFQSSNCNILGACLIYFAIQVTSQCPPSHHHSQKLKFFGPTPPVNVPRELVSFSVLDRHDPRNENTKTFGRDLCTSLSFILVSRMFPGNKAVHR